jgi:hypothetical protein
MDSGWAVGAAVWGSGGKTSVGGNNFVLVFVVKNQSLIIIFS